MNLTILEPCAQRRRLGQVALDEHASALQTAAAADDAPAHDNLASQPSGSSALPVASVLERQTADERRQLAIRVTGDEACVEAGAVEYDLALTD